MAVGFTAGHSTISASAASVASHSVNVNTAGDRCGVVFAITYGNAGTSIFSGATIDGVAATLISEAKDTATEAGNVQVYFLDNITQGAAVAFTANRTNNGVIALVCGVSLSAAAAAEIYAAGIVKLQEDGTYAEQNVDDGSPGTNSLRLAIGYTGDLNPVPVGANSTSLHTHDQGAFGTSICRETTAGQGSRPVGFSFATSDDRAAVHFAVREIPVGIVARRDPARGLYMR